MATDREIQLEKIRLNMRLKRQAEAEKGDLKNAKRRKLHEIEKTMHQNDKK